MPRPLRLESFDPEGSAAAGAALAADAEERRLAAYESGYAAGWEDAVAAQAGDARRLREDLARNLRDLSFTYHEARAEVLKGLAPLLRAMIDQVLPETARATLGARIAEVVAAEAERLGSPPVQIVVAPADRAAVEAALPDSPPFDLALAVEPTLAEGQVHFRFGSEERVLDLPALLDRIRALVTDLLDPSLSPREARHG
jgi:flagellar assembly protein FliH